MTKRSARWTEEQLLESAGQRMSGALRALGLGGKLEEVAGEKPAKKRKGKTADGVAVKTDVAKDSKKASKKTPDSEAAEPVARKKRQGAQTAPIFQSLAMAPATAIWDANTFSLEIPGGRILTYNELYSILQFRKYEAFRYKKLCKGVIERAVFAGGKATPKPFFSGPTRLILVREAAKDMDRDALPIVFKYFLDALKHEGIIDDDNPNIIVDIQSHQKVGTPRLAMRLERLTGWVNPEVPSWSNWLETTTPTVSKKRKGKPSV